MTDSEPHVVGNWQIEVVKKHMYTSGELAELEGRIPGTKLPDMVFGNSTVKITNASAGISYQFLAEDALRLCNIAYRQTKLQSADLKIDSINEIPKDVQVADARLWEERKIPKDTLFKEPGVVQEEVGVHAAVQTSDWTYSTPYKGTVCRHDSHEAPTNVTVSRTENEIPVHRLRQDNPIVYYDEIILYEDELDDCGSSRFNIRFRAMADCWFALVRYYLRVDGVLVRIYDTRIFHSLDSTEILREFQVKESTYEQLHNDGFPFASDWAISPTQSDTVFPFLKLKKIFKDKITY